MTSAAASVPVEPVISEPTFQFDANFQSKIASFAVKDAVFAKRCEGLLKGSYFENAVEGSLVDLANEHYEKFGELPGSKSVWDQMVKDALLTRRIRKETAKEMITHIRTLIALPSTDREFVVGKVSEFARHQAINAAMLKGVYLTQELRFEEAQKLMEEAFRVGAADDFEDIDYWSEKSIEQRSKYREDVATGKIAKTGIPTGIKKIDALLYHGGWGIRELSVLMGGAKKGKSMGLGFFAGRASLLGYSVLYMTLEVSADIIAAREDACLTDTAVNSLGVSASAVVDSLKGHLKAADKPGPLRIVGFASGRLTCRQVRRVLERYKAEGLEFDLLVIDYADIMAPDRHTTDSIENSRQVWLGLRAIAHTEKLAVLTATQTNREGFKEATAKAEHAAEDFNKIRIADLVISINATEEERAAGEARLYFAASRNQAGEFAIQITQEIEKMKFITGVKAIA